MIYGGMVFGMQRTCGISISNAGTGTSIVWERSKRDGALKTVDWSDLDYQAIGRYRFTIPIPL